ncbi:uncharacterized protein LOC126778201 [Nymphalis io]|uniref:uncharacterized protein LOC126778201 n=1 Tax=Inachis io TaxID=171585 RepID=UPI0021692A7F|nr:uncharacterized protein LOC126778201 [Nymphalis io]
MQSKFHENGVITGIADSFCLSCHTYLKLKDVQGHITDSAHQKTFETTSYVERYQEDRIRKVKMGYFCEICNLIIQTLAKTSIHVNEVAHVKNKKTQQLKDTDEGVVAFDDILIKQKAWQGLVNGSCLICNVDYSDEEDHKKDPSHVLKLIQSKFELNKNNFVYRKVDEDTYNCLTCNTIITGESKDEHVNESVHINNYLKCQNDKKLVNVIDPEVIPEKTNSENKIISCINDTENKLRADDNDELLSPSEALKRAIEFAKQNKLKYKRNGTFCKVCNIKISSSLRMMKEHVAESSHKEKVVNETSITLKKVPMDTFIKFSCTASNILFSDVIINDEICVCKLSFHIITKHLQKFKCQACEVTLNSNTVEQHIHSSSHITALEATAVLIDFDKEFVREVRPAVYHCGYCNFIKNSLEGLKNHLKSINHYETKSTVQRRIYIYLPQIKV